MNQYFDIFEVISCIVLSFDKTYIHFQSIFTIMAIFIRLLNGFINGIVIGPINDEDCLAFIHSLMIYLAFTSSELIFYNIIQLIKHYSKHLNDNFYAKKSENDSKYQCMNDICIV